MGFQAFCAFSSSSQAGFGPHLPSLGSCRVFSDGNRSPCSLCHPHSPAVPGREGALAAGAAGAAGTNLPQQEPPHSRDQEAFAREKSREIWVLEQNGGGSESSQHLLLLGDVCLCLLCRRKCPRNCHTPVSHGAEGDSHHQQVSITLPCLWLMDGVQQPLGFVFQALSTLGSHRH